MKELTLFEPSNSFDEHYRNATVSQEGPKSIIEYINSIPSDKLKAIKKRIEFVLREQGISFGNYSLRARESSWDVDIIPHVLNEWEWKTLESGVAQRLTALNLFLKDIYSSKKILNEKIFPIELVLGDPHYLRECVGVGVPHDTYIHIGAFDIMRAVDGNFTVLDDNVTVPSGISYALVNREILRQHFPSVFENNSILPVWAETAKILSKLKECAPGRSEQPRVVLLSPGIHNEAYTEHELLANRMGIPLVLPKDLLVKENCLYMKTMAGHMKVDVLYRRIQDNYLDPVSFFHQSVLGVPGLFSCVRSGNLTVANAIGSGVASSKSFLPFMSSIIRFYLAEEPILKTIPTTLLNQRHTVEEVFQNFEEYVIKPNQGNGGRGIVFGYSTTKEEREKWKSEVLKNPWGYVAQPIYPLSRAKVFNGQGLTNRYIDTRVFAFRGREVSVSTALLTRVSPNETSFMVCNSQGGGSKDTWIRGFENSNLILPNIQNTTKNALLVRVAESVFWLGRYLSRAMIIANSLEVAFSSEIDQLLDKEDPMYKTILRMIASITGSSANKLTSSDLHWQEAFFRHTVLEQENLGSLIANVQMALSNAREIQNYLSEDMWVALRKLNEKTEQMLQDAGSGTFQPEEQVPVLKNIENDILSFYGACFDTLSKNEIFKFIQIGKSIEESQSVVSAIKSTLGFTERYLETKETRHKLQPFIILFLKFLKSYNAYIWNYQTKFDPYLAYRMVLLDRDFPKSIVSQIANIKGQLESIPGEKNSTDEDSPIYICDVLLSRVYSLSLEDHLHVEKEDLSLETKRFLQIDDNKSSLYWTNNLRLGIDILANKIIDKYSYFSNPHSIVSHPEE